MKILAMELSSPRGSIAWRENAPAPFGREFPNDRKHSGAFFEELRVITERFGKPDRIIVGLGPGSYAGTRIAIAAAIGLGAATGAELLGVPSICGIPTSENDYAVVGDARRHAFFFAHIRDRRCAAGPLLCTPPELKRRIGEMRGPVFASELTPTVPQAVIAYPSAVVLTLIDLHSFSAEPLEPIYLREPHITLPKSLPQLRAPTL